MLKLSNHINSKKKKMKENKECFNMYKNIFFTWNLQNKIIIRHWDVELAMIFNVFIFQVFAKVLVPNVSIPKKKKQ
jgi:hypothetical protein